MHPVPDKDAGFALLEEFKGGRSRVAGSVLFCVVFSLCHSRAEVAEEKNPGSGFLPLRLRSGLRLVDAELS